jgi:predicted molibdopterin-dependent oxidoreductase YjgC
MNGDDVLVFVDGRRIAVGAGASVIAALVLAERMCTRRSVSGEARFALCGIGQCQECRVTIDGQPHQLACQVACRSGMSIVSGLEPSA